MQYSGSERNRRNEESKQSAEHDREPWSVEELALLLTWDRSEDELTVMGEILGRTREACRERFYKAVREGGTARLVEREVTTTTTVESKRVGRSRKVTKVQTERWSYGAWSEEDRSDWYV